MKKSISFTAVILAALATPALAHTGTGAHFGFASGFAHPFAGLDHLLAMLSVGVLAGLSSRGTATLLAPATFVIVMVFGAVLGASGIALPMVETAIALSVVAFGLAILLGQPIGTVGLAALAGLFALFHGHAHGAEAVGEFSGYVFGFALGTGIIHLGGIVVARLIASRPRLTRFIGGAVAMLGLALAAA